jgi:peptidoglycan/xylan/chitin deacetylase (PgdA/CDA1 family)
MSARTGLAARTLSRRKFLQGALGAGLAGAASLAGPAAAGAAGSEADGANALFTLPGTTPAIALTFDDGLVNVARLLDLCRPLGLRLTLFPTGQVIDAQPAVWQQAVADGHELGCHTYSHRALGGQSYGVVADELRRFFETIHAQLGAVPVHWFRPPYGSGWSSRAVQAGAQDFGMQVVMWNQANSASRLSTKPGVKEVVEAFKRDARPGNVVLYHFLWQEVGALEALVDHCARKGWRVGTLSELVAA